MEVVAGYDRSGLIHASIETLQRDLLEEAAIVSVVIIIFLFHFRSALIPILTLPIAVLAAFIPMYYLHVTSNIMSLGGLALAIGVLVDAAIVMVENGYRQLSEHQAARSEPLPEPQRRKILLDAAKQVGPAIFFSLVIIVVSFLPVFLLEAQEGRMFRPLAWTKTLAVGFSSVLAITLVPVLMILFIRGRLIPESRNPISRITQAIYLPILRLCLRFRKTTLLLNLVFLVVTLPLALHIGSQFMPPLYEGSALYMPTALPGISIGQASQLLQEQDRIIRTFPEVETVFGSIGRSDSATDNAPLDMYDTTLMLKPRSQWRPGMTYEKLIQEMDAKLQFPGLSNTWTMPVENRLDMELTGIKTPLGLKIQGPNLEGIQQVGAQVQQILTAIPEMRSIFAERVSQGFYLNIEVNRAEAARYGLTIAEVQQAITSGIGGEMVAENVEGRERYPVNVRYNRDFRDNVEELRRVLIGTPSGAQIPVADVAKLSFSRGPSMIRDEDGALTGYVYIDLNTKDYGGFVTHASDLLKQKLALPPGFTYKWSGEYEFELRAKERLQLILPIVFFVIFMLLYVVFHSVTEAAVLIFPTIYALTGGLILQKVLGYNFSVAVWVGYIALFGIAVETGVVMVVYLHEALDHRLKSGVPLRHEDIEAAVIEGAVHRLRPKLMTVCVVLASLIPILVGNRCRRRCDETHCRPSRRRHDHLNDSRPDFSARIFCADEGARAASRDSATKRLARARLNVALSRAVPFRQTRCGSRETHPFFHDKGDQKTCYRRSQATPNWGAKFKSTFRIEKEPVWRAVYHASRVRVPNHGCRRVWGSKPSQRPGAYPGRTNTPIGRVGRVRISSKAVS